MTTGSTSMNATKQNKKPLTRPCSLEDMDRPVPPPPPTPICEDINNRIRLNPAHAYPHFDFASYVQHRAYTLCVIDFGSTTSACFLDNGVHDIVADIVSQLDTSPRSKPLPPPCFEVNHTKDKGLGMFATTPIRSGAQILTEHPAIVTPYLLGISLPLAEMYTELFESLPKPSLALASSLATSSKEDDDIHIAKPSPRQRQQQQSKPILPPVGFYEDIMQTNALAIDLHVPLDIPHRELKTHRALFLSTSRCNHSCTPNASWSWNPSTLKLTLTALQPIAIGEEITIAYIPLFESCSQRRDTLRERYGFECVCETCRVPSYSCGQLLVGNGDDGDDDAEQELDKDSDDVDDVDDNLPTFEEWCCDPTLPDDLLINAHKNALYLIEQGLSDTKFKRLSIPHMGINGPSSFRGYSNSISDSGSDSDSDSDSGEENEVVRQKRRRQRNRLLRSNNSIVAPPVSTLTTQAIDHHVDAIAMCYGALGDVTNFRNWIAIVKDARVGSGAHPEQRVVFNKWLSNPASFPAWRRREKARKGRAEEKRIGGKFKWMQWK